MQYDFRKVREAIALSGKTYKQVEDLTGIDETTISRVIRSGRAHQSTAVRLANAFRVSMKDIQVQSNGKKTHES